MRTLFRMQFTSVSFQRQAGGTTFCRYIKLMLSVQDRKSRKRHRNKRGKDEENENSINNRWK